MKDNLLNIFGLTMDQTLLLYSMEYQLILNDIQYTKDEDKKLLKKEWTAHWKMQIESLFQDNKEKNLLTKKELDAEIAEEISRNPNRTWYHLIVLESVAFVPYTYLSFEDEDYTKEINKKFKKLKYNDQLEYLEELVQRQNHMDVELVTRYEKTYKNSLNKGLGKRQKLVNKALIVVAIPAMFAAGAGLAAAPLAVLIKGAAFAGLSGAALVSASLAALGGGAVAIGGAGMAGGVAVLVGGGALLGGVTGGALIAAGHVIAKESPDIIISQGAKLSVVLKEIVLNNQKDVVNAQLILQDLKQQVLDLNEELQTLRLDASKNKNQIRNLEKAIKGLEKLYRDNVVFESSFEIGLDTEKRMN